MLLIEQVDRLSRLSPDDWTSLKANSAAKKASVVSLDLATSHAALKATHGQDDFTKGMINAVNRMLLDMLAVIARKDYDDRHHRQAEGIRTAKTRDVYKGRQADQTLHNRIKECPDAGKSPRENAEFFRCAVSTVQRVKSA